MLKHCFIAMPLTASMLLGCVRHEAGEAEQRYAVMTVQRTDIETVDLYPASIRGQQDVDIYPQVDGKITEVAVREGERVRRGQRLFVIDQVSYRAALRTAEANLHAAEAEVATARLNCEGKRKLHDNRVVSAFELQKSENELRSAEAAAEQAEAQVTDARNNLSYTVVVAPSDGVVGTLPYRVGALVSPSSASPLTTVSDNARMYVYFSLPESRVIALVRRYGSADKALASMPEVSLTLSDGSPYAIRGRIETVSGVLDASTGSVSVRAVFSNPDGLLRSGGAGSIGLVERTDSVLVIPQSATYELQDKVYAYRVIGSRTVSTPIRVRAVAEQKLYVVTGGLAQGDTIVAEGVGLLQDGMRISMKEEMSTYN